MSFAEDARKLLQDFGTPELPPYRVLRRRVCAAERHTVLLDRPEAMRREIGLQVRRALVTRRLEYLQGKQQEAQQ